MTGGHSTSGHILVGRRYQKRRQFHHRPATGFTVIEVLIVLAVTGLLFVTTAALLSGKQNQTAFDQSIRQVQQQIQKVINDVSIGYYPNVGNVQCTAGGSGPNIVSTPGTQQGTNSGCIFLGKAMQFGIGSNPEIFAVHSIAGLQKSGSSDVSTLAQAKPKAIAPSSAEPNIPNADETEQLDSGLTTYRMWYNNGAGDKKIGEVAFTSSLAQFDSSSSIVSGSQQLIVVPVDDTGIKSALHETGTDGVDAINSNLASSPTSPSNGVFICFVSAGTTQSGLITIGNNARQLSVKLDIKSDTTCNGLGV